MKLLISIVKGADNPSENLECPKPNLLNKDGKNKCNCYEDSKYMICNEIDKDWVNSFEPDKFYKIDTLVIKNSPNFALFSEKFHNVPTKKGIAYKSLIFELIDKPETAPVDNINALIAVATTSVEIKLKGPPTFEIDATQLNPSLISISLSNVKVSNLADHIPRTWQNVQRLVLNNVILDKDVDLMKIDQPNKLAYIEISSCPQLKSFMYIPTTTCPDNQIVLNLQNNENLNKFDMSKLFDKEKKCKYHIDLSGSKISPDFFKSNQEFINKADTNGQLYIVLRPVTKTLAICPTDAELKKVGCLCYSESQYLICDGSSGFFDFKQRYIFKTVVIRNSPKLPFWSEHITKKDDFVVESLIILQGNDDVEVAENFEELLQMPTKSFKIVTNGQIKRLNLYNIQSNLTSISVTGVPQLAHKGFSAFNFGEESTLEHLQLRSVIFDPVIETFVLSGLPLKMLEITKSNLKGLVSVVPSKCPPENERIVIDLRSNTEMTGFEFSSLFKTTFDSKTCHYHIDLSDNPKLNTNILINNIPTLKDHGAN
ncbi:hypothetical protein TYRP_010275, partial [Tyrophagus putrescentiae]